MIYQMPSSRIPYEAKFFLAPKGHNVAAQGNALRHLKNEIPSPERAQYEVQNGKTNRNIHLTLSLWVQILNHCKFYLYLPNSLYASNKISTFSRGVSTCRLCAVQKMYPPPGASFFARSFTSFCISSLVPLGMVF